MEGFLSPEEILNELDLKDNMTAVEFGCGAGAFALALAKQLKQGRVYGLDVQEEKISALKNKTLLEKLKNVFAIHCDLESEGGSTLHKNSADIVLIPNVLFQAENKYAIIKESERILKQGGQLLIIDWQKSSLLAPNQGTISSDEIKKITESAELVFKKEFSAGEHHFALLFNKI
ncbi:MAG: methyltransferase domain-containing protein [Patescibacteria group bacterium]